ncbi:ribonuclease H [Cinnamomum micranthum f. kanehirae]|uniref:Ribonuclease H n=1 Tax=Cinnamomum micranthum f. kanehirae TaxID=337451 RepID=A0A3S3MPM2_9MAGN|nr:ribonuclease H [Cinnamomum micranthum f. kanehirae]
MVVWVFETCMPFDLTRLGKQSWNFISNPNGLVSRFLAKYFPHGDFLSAELDSNPSFIWKSIWSARFVIQKGCIWRIGCGSRINVWKDPWLKDDSNLKIATSVIPGLESLTVSDLWIPHCREWDVELLHELFEPRNIAVILSIPLGNGSQQDRLIWHFDKEGSYTVKSGYRCILADDNAEIQGNYNEMWRKLW